MRLFYAIELDDSTRGLLADNLNKLKPKAVRANFTRAENLHLTLRFMGEIETGHVVVLKKILDYIAGRFSAFCLELAAPGVFERGHKSIVWWGLKGNEQLNDLQSALEQEIRLNGFTAESKPYSPHITLAREFVSQDSIVNVIKLLPTLNHSFHVGAVSLMESTRQEGKLKYLCRYRAELGRTIPGADNEPSALGKLHNLTERWLS
ncbi:MAG: RNA 2',3'-cyclic phosphodiesterase [Thermoclostridium sp.]|nr:RNA 2',3'-cyclic phosphodiesterase [Thermoclostridium sp.]